jgi:hypothetical protein
MDLQRPIRPTSCTTNPFIINTFLSSTTIEAGRGEGRERSNLSLYSIINGIKKQEWLRRNDDEG